MKSRPIAAAFFVTLCLLLCGLILRRQIAAHPLPPTMAEGHFDGGRQGGDRMGLQDWHPAGPSIISQVHHTVQGQLTALHQRDGQKAMSYQSRFMRQRFSDPNQFEQMIASQYPEFMAPHKVHFGPVWTDKNEQFARTIIMVEGEDGHRARGEYLLVREGGQFKVGGVRAERIPD